MPDKVRLKLELVIHVLVGGFGTLLVQAHEWANPEATKRSYELVAQHVMARYQGSAQRQLDSRAHVMEHRDEYLNAAGGAITTTATTAANHSPIWLSRCSIEMPTTYPRSV